VSHVDVSFELGGKSLLIVFADADLELALTNAVGQYDNAGQVCLDGTRLLVEASDLRAIFEADGRVGRENCAGRSWLRMHWAGISTGVPPHNAGTTCRTCHALAIAGAVRLQTRASVPSTSRYSDNSLFQ
jgi:Aldehyde dehydrogenase family